nr:MAG TPA: hypothetical protein [Caudoviricetes sp.]
MNCKELAKHAELFIRSIFDVDLDEFGTDDITDELNRMIGRKAFPYGIDYREMVYALYSITSENQLDTYIRVIKCFDIGFDYKDLLELLAKNFEFHYGKIIVSDDQREDIKNQAIVERFMNIFQSFKTKDDVINLLFNVFNKHDLESYIAASETVELTSNIPMIEILHGIDVMDIVPYF